MGLSVFACSGVSANVAMVLAAGNGEVSSEVILASAVGSSVIARIVAHSWVDNKIVCYIFNLWNVSVEKHILSCIFPAQRKCV